MDWTGVMVERTRNVDSRRAKSLKGLRTLKWSFAVATVFALALPVQARTCQDLFGAGKSPLNVFEASETKSQKIRDNQAHYWNFVREQGQSYLGFLWSFRGLVGGDAHPGNFIVAPLGGRLRFFMADIKDAGHAPYIFDVARTIYSSYSVIKKKRRQNDPKLAPEAFTRTMLEAYLQGLNASSGLYRVPESVKESLSFKLKDYQEMQREYVEDHTKGRRFKFKEGKLEKIEQTTAVERQMYREIESDISAAVHRILPNARVLDLALRPRERGGSQSLIRYWALVREKGEMMILEFKEIGEPATAQFAEQMPTRERYDLIMKTFWPASDSTYGVTAIQGRAFWMRPKKVDVFRVPYKQRDKSELEMLLDLAEYSSFMYGYLHSRTLPSVDYVNVIATRMDDLVRGMTSMNRDYVDKLKRDIRDAEADISPIDIDWN